MRKAGDDDSPRLLPDGSRFLAVRAAVGAVLGLPPEGGSRTVGNLLRGATSDAKSSRILSGSAGQWCQGKYVEMGWQEG